MQIDRDTKTGEYLAFISYNFDKTCFDIIEKLNNKALLYRYNIPDAELKNLTLQPVLPWIYANYVLERKK